MGDGGQETANEEQVRGNAGNRNIEKNFPHSALSTQHSALSTQHSALSFP